MQIARTTLGSKILGQNTTHMDHFAKLAVDAVMRLKGSTDLQMVHIIKKIGGSLEDSFLDEGFILEKKIGVGQPKRIENAKILLANTAMDNDKVKIYSAKVQVDSPAELAKIEKAERVSTLQTPLCYIVLFRTLMHLPLKLQIQCQIRFTNGVL